MDDQVLTSKFNALKEAKKQEFNLLVPETVQVTLKKTHSEPNLQIQQAPKNNIIQGEKIKIPDPPITVTNKISFPE